MESTQNWIDGFLLVGNQPVLDLLNTRLITGVEQKEMLTDTSALVRWLLVSGFVSVPAIRSKLRGWSDGAEAKDFPGQLLAFREEVRIAVLRLEDGKQPDAVFLKALNRRLFAHPVRKSITSINGSMQSVQASGTSIADTLWAALLDATERLLVATEPGRVRKCESCVVHFLDISKKNARRWCSMRLCGNRIKVAAYQNRRRSRESIPNHPLSD